MNSPIAFIGDIHGDFNALAKIVGTLPIDVPVVQVGDFGYWPELRSRFIDPGRHVLFIDGNHDHVTDLREGKCDWPNAEYVPRGAVRDIGDARVLFLGGATSVDRKWRPKRFGLNAWFPEEEVTEFDVRRALENAKNGVDMLVTHSPPDWMVRKHFSPDGLREFDIEPSTWRDRSAERVEYIWRALDTPPLVCGHMHQSVTDGKCRILNINEVVVRSVNQHEKANT